MLTNSSRNLFDWEQEKREGKGSGGSTEQGRGRLGGNKHGSGLGGNCVCPKCGNNPDKVQSQRTIPNRKKEVPHVCK